jgi:SAM-dependent methyltransferase
MSAQPMSTGTMNAQPVHTGKVVLLRAQRSAPTIEWLCGQVARNRFMPVPPPERCFVGDGDFRAVGAEFLGHFVRLGGLKPTDRVLEIGCGIGRMALPLTQYLTGAYDGLDIVEDGIAWCREAITPAYPEFRFHHLDAANALYNPEGRLDAARVSLPMRTENYDFVLLTSVFTHLRQQETEHYVAEIARVLRTGGRCFLSLFLVDHAARTALRDGTTRPVFMDGEGPEFIADPNAPNGAVAYDEGFLLGLCAAHGLRPASPIVRGHWSGRTADSYQDLLVLEKTETVR